MPSEAGKKPAPKGTGEVFDAKTNKVISEALEAKKGALESLNAQAELISDLNEELAEMRQRSLPEGWKVLVAEYHDERGNVGYLAANTLLQDVEMMWEPYDDPIDAPPRRSRVPSMAAGVAAIQEALERQDAAMEKRKKQQEKDAAAAAKKAKKSTSKKATKAGKKSTK